MRHLLALALLLVAGTAQAREIPAPTVLPDVPDVALTRADLTLPKYAPCEAEGKRMACYSEVSQKTLLKIEQHAFHLLDRHIRLQAAYEARSKEVVLIEMQLLTVRQNVKLSTARVDTVTAQLMTEIEKKNDWRAKAEAPVVWPYVLGIGSLTVAIGMLLGVYVSN